MNFFDHIFFINLDRRPDRLKSISEQLKRVGFDAERISAVDGSLLNPNQKIGNGWNHKGVAGCLLSHRKLVQVAKERGYKNFLAIEDDTILADDFRERFDSYIKQLPPDWDMIYFGGNHLSLDRSGININVGKCKHTLTTNMYGMSDRLYDHVLDNVSHNVDELREPIDVFYLKIQQSSIYNCFYFKPHLAWQASIFSDIENKTQDMSFLQPSFKKMSLIISSCNQIDRLRYCLKSAITQKYYNYEVIVADDNSVDGSVEMVLKDFPSVKLSNNPHSIKGVYTLAQNWNAAANMATGNRLIFTNADCLLPSNYVNAHADGVMEDDIVFGPNERTDHEIDPLLKEEMTPMKLIEKYMKISASGVTKDLRHDDSAYTYNKVYGYYYPWGNNMSVPANKFFEVGGFPALKEYGGEEMLLCKKLSVKKGLKIKSNKNTINIHMWHPVTNKAKKPFNEFDYNEYIDN